MDWNLPRAILLVYQLGITAAIEVFRELQGQELTRWLKALNESELVLTGRPWEEEAREFWETDDSNLLMHRYYRGMPSQLLSEFRENFEQTLQKRNTEWTVNLMEKAREATQPMLKTIPSDKFDNRRGHRLQAFPAIITAQCLPIATLAGDDTSRYDLSKYIALLLSETQIGGSYTESARDQINQIVPQILIEQLLAGPIAWENLVVTNPVVERFVALGSDREMAHRFETGLALTLQFLTYYRASLESPQKKQRFQYECATQSKKIDEYFDSFKGQRDPVLRSMLPWIAALQTYTAKAASFQSPYRNLVRQSSAAIIGRHHKTQKMPKKIWQLCVLNNLRAAHRSLSLPDCADRRNRVLAFLSKNGVTRKGGLQVIDNTINRNERPDFYEDMQEFVYDLPEEVATPTLSPAVFSTASGHTVDQIWSGLSYFRWKKWEETLVQIPQIPPDIKFWEKAIEHSIRPIIRSGFSLYRRIAPTREISRIEKLRKLINEIISDSVSSGLTQLKIE